MGYTRHHAIIVTTWDKTRAQYALNAARNIFTQQYIPQLSQSPVNDWWTLFVPPDGSKEGWEESNRGDEERGKFLQWLEAHRYSDGSSPFSWVEVQYGDDEDDNRVLQDENTNAIPHNER